MFRQEFLCKYILEHQDLVYHIGYYGLMVAAEIAWERAVNKPTGDVLQWWMQDTLLELGQRRVLFALTTKYQH